MPLVPKKNKHLTPRFTILANGDDVSSKFGIASLMVSKCVNKIPYAQVWFNDGSVPQQTFEISSSALLIPGVKLEIKIGYESDTPTIFKGIIIKHSIKSPLGSASMLVIEAKHEAVQMTVGRKNRYFDENSKDSDAMELVLADYSFDSKVDPTKAEHERLVQYYCTDWDFLVSRAEVNGQLVIAGDDLLTSAPPKAEASVFDAVYGNNIVEFEAGIDARQIYSATKASSWDYAGEAILEVDGTDPKFSTPGNLSYDELAKVIGLSEFQLQHSGFINNEELKAWSDAKLLRSQMSKVIGRIRIIGEPEIVPGNTINLQGLGDRFNGDAYVSSVTQSYMQNDTWYTDIEFGLNEEWFANRYENIIERPAAGLLPGVYGLQNGVVTEIADDPGSEFRVRVNIPVIGGDDGDGIWARLCQFDAGAGASGPRGAFFYPEEGDEVVVGFFNDDPRDPVILGRLYSSAQEPPFDVTSDNYEKGYVSREELKLTFNDEVKSIVVETPNGNKVTLSDDDGGIILEDENGNTITMDSGGIAIDSGADITIKATGDVNIEGGNVAIAAQQQFSADGMAGAEITSSAVASIKGSATTAIG